MRRLAAWVLGCCASISAPLLLGADAAPPTAPGALLLEINGPIGPATSHYISQGLKRAAKQGSAIVILRMSHLDAAHVDKGVSQFHTTKLSLIRALRHLHLTCP